MAVCSIMLNLTTYQWFAVAGFLFCVGFCTFYFWRIIKAGRPTDLATQAGNPKSGVWYAFTGAMHPARKESAYLHKATYGAGLVYHAGTFFAMLAFFLLLAGTSFTPFWANLFSIVLVVTGIAGFGILVKRLKDIRLKTLSNPDDYIANILVTAFQWLTATALLNAQASPVLWVLGGVLFIYIPLGKLRHCVFFFAARYHLGYFYGWRGVWPLKSYDTTKNGGL